MIWTELPAGYYDAITTSDAVGLFVVNTVPEEDSVDALVGTNVTVELFSTHSEAVDLTKTDVDINGVNAFSGGTFQSGFDGPGSSSAMLGGHDARIVVDPTTDFDSEQVVTVRVASQTTGAAYSVDYSYTFTVEDTTKPQLVSCTAVDADVVRFTFSEAMKADSADGANDALNPANYSFQFQPASDRQAAVDVLPVSVEQYSTTQFDVTTDIELTFWKTYRGICGDIADDSSNANLLGTLDRTADFESWHPPNWPPRRDYDLWMQLSPGQRAADIDGDTERFLSAKQDQVDIALWDCDRMEEWWDPDRAPEAKVDAMLAEMGNPFKFDLNLNRKRKLVYVLPEVYQKKGTGPGLISVVRFFLGIEITAITEFNAEAWRLGHDKLGITTVLGPSNQAALYTFLINVDRALTTTERRELTAIARYMKPGHTHFRIIEPGDPEYVDHWMLGFSKLGQSTLLHDAP